ncbi:MAG: radical SAM protein, partial [Anaerolineaceae bacterium]|nr:radical SAM protein [Anaerolineaceae bacterium]
MPSTIQISPDGKLDLPEDIKKQLGFSVKGLVRIDVNANEVTISRSINHLNQVYIEPTNACNLTCSTCMRNVWDEPLGFLSKETFERILEGLRAFSPIPKVFFGGFGEPLFHPQIQEMVAAAKQLGAEVELITNGILLDDKVSDWMLNLGLDRVWVSIDGASPESYADVRLGDALPIVLENILGLMGKRIRRELVTPALGIAFVAMKRNIADLPGVIAL